MKKIVAILCLLAMLLSMTTLGAFSASAASAWIGKAAPKDVEYSFAVIGDIQTLTEKDETSGSRFVSSIFSWLLSVKDSRKIEYVFGLGDTIETLSTWPEDNYHTSFVNPAEWQIASEQFHRLDGIIPYLVVRGNHDDEAGYHKHICTDAYKAQMDEFFYDPEKPAVHGNSMSNSYQKIEICGVKYLMMALDYDINDDVIAWANEVIAANPDYRVIVSVHVYLSSSGIPIRCDVGQPGEGDQTDGDLWHDYIEFDGNLLWDRIFSKHPNMFMVFCGHVSVNDPVVNTRVGDHGNEVFQVLVDPQGRDKREPGGMVYLLNFKNGGEKIEVEYYSTVKFRYYGADNQFTMNTPKCLTTEPTPPVTTTEPTTTQPEATTVITEATTEAVSVSTSVTSATAATTAATTLDATTAAATTTQTGGCGGYITATVSVACVLGSTLAAFAMRKRKEE